MDAKIAEKHEQYAACVLEHQSQLRVYLRSLAVAPDWVDDIAQEALLVAYREWESFDPTRDFGKWVRGIAANIVRNEIRKDARRKRILHTGLSQFLLDRQESLDATPEPARLAAVRQCVEQLPPKSRQMVHGTYRDGYSATELAPRVDMAPAAVRQALVRIRRRLKECIESRLGEEAP
ncbi:MAG: sigma-70 family RNA polymerase sigma factor [Pirellulales bacterium]